MSTVVDSRLVEMSFDNSDFEKNVKTSLNTLGKLNDDLDNITDSASGMTELGKAIDGISFGGLESAASLVGERFNALSVIAISALNRITNQAMATGEQLIKSLSVQQIQEGWGKYAQKTEAVQTIMSATSSTWEKNAEALGFEGTQMEFVSEQLEKLNWFSDETSYSFTDMTSNIGKFTSAGVSLTDAVTAMEGISTWAAKSGQNTQSASRAMYNLSQAMSVGSVKLMDWRSIENANMATQEFKKTAIETAVAVGTLKEAGDGLYKTTSGNTVSITDFNSALSDGWFSADVLMQTLTKYGKGATKLSEICEDYGVTASQFLTGMENYTKGTKTIDDIATNLGINAQTLIPLFDELNSEEYQLGVSSFKAAQEAKTFAEALDATKDAVSTGWMTTFETIFGNYEEAKVLWTDLANALWDVFAAGGEERNQLLSDWKEYGAIIGGGRDDLIQAFWDIWDAVGAVFGTIGEAFRNVFPKTTFGDLIKYVKAFKSFAEGLMIGEETADKLNRAFTGLFSVLDIGLQIFKALFSIVGKVFGHFSAYATDVLDVAAAVGDWITQLDNSIKELGIFEEIADRIANVIIAIGEWINKAFTITPVEAFKKGIYNINDVLDLLKAELKDFGMMFVNVIEAITGIDIIDEAGNFSDQILEFGNKVYTAFDEIFTRITGTSFANFSTAIKSIFENFINGVKTVATTIGGFLGKGFGAVLYGTYTLITGLLSSISEKMEKFLSSSENVAQGVSSVFDAIMDSAFFKFLDAVFITIGSVLQSLFEMIVGAGAFILNFIKDTASAFIGMAGDDNLFDYIRLAVTALLDAGVITTLKSLIDTLNGFSINGISDAFDSLGEALGNLSGNTQEKKLMQIAIAIGVLAGSLYLLSTIKTENLIQGISMVTTLMMELMGTAEALTLMKTDILNTVPKTLLALSVSVLILATAMKKLSELNPDQITMGLTSITALLAELTVVAIAMSKTQTTIAKGCTSLIALALAVTVLSVAMKIIATMSWEGIAKGLSAVAIILYSVSTISNLLDSKKILALGAAMIPLALGFTILAGAMALFSLLSWEGILKGFSVVALILGSISIMSKLIDPKNILALGAAIIPLATGFTIFGGAMAIIGNLSWEEIAKGLSSIAILLYSVSAMSIMIDPKNILALGAAMIPLATGFAILGGVMNSIAKMSWEGILKGISAIGIMLYTISALSMTTNPGGIMALSGAMLVLGAALAIMVPELLIIGGTSWKRIAKGLFTLASAITVIAVAGMLIQPAIAGILALAGAMAAVGAAVALFGIGVSALAAGLAILSTLTAGSIVAILAAVEVLILGIINLIPTIALGLATALAGVFNALKMVIQPLSDLLVVLLEALLAIFVSYIPTIIEIIGIVIQGIFTLINDNLPIMFETLGTFLDGVIELLREYIPKLIDLVGELIVTLLDKMAYYTPYFIQSAVDIVVAIITGLANAIPQIIEAGVELVRSFLVGMAEGLTGVIDAAFEMVVTFIDGLATAIEERGPELREAIMHLITAIVTNVIDLGTDLISTASTLVTYLVTGLLNGIEDVASAVWEIITAAADTVAGFFSRFLTYGKTLIIKLKTGIVSMASTIAEKAGDLITGALDAIGGFLSDFWDVGVNIVQGMIDGISDWAQNLWNKVMELGAGVLQYIKDFLGIESPSKEFYEVGKYCDLGFMEGIDGYANKVYDATERIGESTLTTMLDVLKELSEELNENDEFNPVITPVLDLSNLESGASSISSMLGGNKQLINLASSLSTAQSDNKNNQNGVNSTETAGANPQTYQFIQNNYSPKALSRIDIYRQTSNQFAFMKGMVGGGA